MSWIFAYQFGRNVILKNNAAGKRNRYDVYRLSPTRASAKRIGCELTLGHAKTIATVDKRNA